MKLALIASLIPFSGLFLGASAQVGSGGWAPYSPTKTVQLRGSGTTYKDSAGIEIFTMARGDERSEMRIHNDYKDGTNQFEGYVRVSSGQGTSVHQVFKFLMIVAYPQNGGELHQHSQTFLSNGAFGKWVRVNTIHYTASHKAEVYIDGELKTTMADHAWDSPNGWYNKYGVYNTNSGSKSEWRDIRYWKQSGSISIAPIDPRASGPEYLPTLVFDLRGKRILSPVPAGLARGVYFPWSAPGSHPSPGMPE